MALNGYLRQAAANIQPGLAINAEDFNAEFNQIQTAFDNSVGHDHSGLASGTGQKIGLTTSVTGILPKANGGMGVNVATTAVSVVALSTTTTLAVGTSATVGTTLGVTGATTLTGAVSMGSTLAVAGTSTIHALSATSGTFSTTLGVTGATTLSSTLSAGASTLTSLTVTNNATVGGTLGVTGAATFTSVDVSATLKENGNRVISGNNKFSLLYSHPANPASTTSATYVMMGLGVATSTSNTGRVLVTMSGNFTNNSTTIGAIQLRWDTTAIPANGVAATGTAIGNAQNIVNSTLLTFSNFSITVAITGIPLNTGFWVDAALISDGTNALGIGGLNIVIVEI